MAVPACKLEVYFVVLLGNRTQYQVHSQTETHQALQVKYDHAVAAAQKSTSGHTGTSDDDTDDGGEDEEGRDGTRRRRTQKDSLLAAEEEQKAAELVLAVLKAQRKLQQLQASCCCSPLLLPFTLQNRIPDFPPEELYILSFSVGCCRLCNIQDCMLCVLDICTCPYETPENVHSVFIAW